MPKTYRVRLSEEERASLEEITRKRSQKAEPVKRALVLLAADESEAGPAWTDEEIAAVYPVSLRTVERLRRRLVEHGLERALYGVPRGPKQPARKFDARTEAHLIALRCSDPPEGHAAWTLQLLADQMVALDYAESISRESVRQLLKKTSSSPGASGSG
jgi:transposase